MIPHFLKYKVTVAIFLVHSFLSTGAKAQNDANCGIVLDGQMIDNIDCWNFQEAGVAFPVSLDKWEKYDAVAIKVSQRIAGPNGKNYLGDVNGYNGNGEFAPYSRILCFYIEKSKFAEWFSGASLGYWKLDIDGKPTVELKPDQTKNIKDWHTVADKEWADQDMFIVVEVVGHFRGGKMLFTDRNGAIYKGSQYDEGNILYRSKEYHIKTYYDKSFMATGPKGIPGVDKKVPCTLNGKSFDLKIEAVNYRNDLFIVKNSNSTPKNQSSNNDKIKSNSSSESKINKATSITKTTSSQNSSLKPLDKNKPGYFAEKDGSQITQEGYKKDGKLNGEVRIYTVGKIREVCTYVNDEKDGLSTVYYDNGKMEMTGSYKTGEKQGEWKEFNNEGKLISTKKYLNGEVQD